MRSLTRAFAVGSMTLTLVAALAASPAWSSATPHDAELLPQASAYSHLDAVSALSATEAWVVGGYFNGAVSKTLVEHWDGQVWDEMPGPNPGGASGSFLQGVSAVSAADVWAVGRYGTETGVDQTLVGHWDGTGWVAVPSPNPDASIGSRLRAVSARSATDAWAVGTYQTATTGKTLIEHWDGTGWTLVDSPNPGGKAGSALLSVTAAAENDVWAVGYTGPETRTKTLIEHWDGTRWSTVPGPSLGYRSSALRGVSAVSQTEVWAVGDANGAKHTLVEHWDGNGWSVTASPSPGAAALSGVSAMTTLDVWAVGTSASQATGEYVTLTEHWNGSKWRKVSSTNPDDSIQAGLVGVSAVSPSDVWSAGSYDNGSRSRPLIEHWDGKAWSQP